MGQKSAQNQAKKQAKTSLFATPPSHAQSLKEFCAQSLLPAPLFRKIPRGKTEISVSFQTKHASREKAHKLLVENLDKIIFTNKRILNAQNPNRKGEYDASMDMSNKTKFVDLTEENEHGLVEPEMEKQPINIAAFAGSGLNFTGMVSKTEGAGGQNPGGENDQVVSLDGEHLVTDLSLAQKSDTARLTEALSTPTENERINKSLEIKKNNAKLFDKIFDTSILAQKFSQYLVQFPLISLRVLV